jgi:sigma-B regulation protein RsbU (phosphoserine phosphatase)
MIYIGDVNALLCRDTNRTGSFVTLFYLEIDRQRNMISWVRGGHEPAIVYSLKTKSFSEFKGRGIALGVDPGWIYECNEVPISGEEQFILIGSDGVWEVENGAGEQFGKDRLKKIIRENSHLDPTGLVRIIIAEIDVFKGEHPQHDDITLALIKTW